MKFDFYCGPFELEVHWLRSSKPRALNVPFLRFYHNKDAGFSSLYPKVKFEILDAAEKLSTLPAEFSENSGNWRTWRRSNGHYVLQIWSGETNGYAIEADISADYLVSRVFCLDTHPSKSALSVMLAEVTRWVAAHLAFSHGGFLVHTSAIQCADGTVLLGMGPSGAGKSTIARFFKRSAGFRILTDETCLVLQRDGIFLAYGTPWPGMLNTAVNAGGALVRIFILEKTAQHTITPLSPLEAMLRLTREIFIPPWNSQVTTGALDSAARLIEAVPPSILGFKKDKSVVQFVEESLYGRPAKKSRKEALRAADRDKGGLKSGTGLTERL